MPLNSARATLIVVVLIALAGCRADPQPTPAPLLAPPPPSTKAHAYSSTFVVQTALLPDQAGLLLLGRRRPEPGSWASEAWIAQVDDEGALRWETSVDIPGAWAEDVIVDPLGGLHVFGRSVNDGAWLASLDAQGQQQALHPLPNAALRGFGLQAAELHVLLDAQDPDPDTNCPAIVNWTRVGSSQPAALTTVLGSAARWTNCWEANRCPSSNYEEGPDPDDPESQACWDEHEAINAAIELLEKAMPSPPALALGEVRQFELGSSVLLAVQLPPQAGEDARVVLRRYDEGARQAGLAEFEALAAAPVELPLVSFTDADELERSFIWLWEAMPDWADADDERTAALGAWLLERDCDYTSEADTLEFNECATVHEFPNPKFFAPGDACWRYWQLTDHLAVVSGDAFVANLPRWLEVLALEYQLNNDQGRDEDFHNRKEDRIDDDILTVALASPQAEAVIRALLLDFDDLDAVDAGFRALETLPEERVVPFALELLAETRHRPNLCGTAGGLRYGLVEYWGGTPPAWEADLSSKCDILYVLCTGMQLGLDALVTDSRGLVTRVQTCDDWSAKSSHPDDDEGNPLCRPERRRVAPTDIDIPVHFPTACAAGNPLMQHRYSCEDPAMLKQTHDFRFRTKRDASLELTRIDVFVEQG